MDTGPAFAAFPDRKEVSSAAPAFPTPYLQFGVFHLDLKRHVLFRDGSRVRLQEKVYLALVTLLEHRGEVVTRESLTTRLWPKDTHVNFDASVNTAVNKLRQALGDLPEKPLYVETIPKKGYRFISQVEFLPQPLARHVLSGTDSLTEEFLGQSFEPQTPSLNADRSKLWFAAAVIALLIASILFGAAVSLYSHWHI
jgi:DNA-binding winged helix-turn-helix (wHTH) protein